MYEEQAILANLVATRAEERPDGELLTFVHIDSHGEMQEESRTYADLWRHGSQLAGALTAAGMGVGDNFALVMQNHPEFVDVMVASSICGTSVGSALAPHPERRSIKTNSPATIRFLILIVPSIREL